MFLSIIIPVYNVENYLERCLNSIKKQIFQDYEVLLIDDGSTDSSSELCDELAKNDMRFHVYHKENGGLSDARNYGLKRAKGDYIAFLDSDDFVTDDAYKKLTDVAIKHSADIVIGNAVDYISKELSYPKIKNKRKESDKVYDGTEFLVNSFKNKTMSIISVLGIYRKELILTNNLFFKKGILHEDELWTPQLYLHAKRVVYIDLDFYMHYQRDGSIMHKKDMTMNSLDTIKICYELDEIYAKVGRWKYRKVLDDQLATLYLSAFNVGKLYRKEYKKIIKKKFVFKKTHSVKNYMKFTIFFINGNLYCKINDISKKYKKES